MYTKFIFIRGGVKFPHNVGLLKHTFKPLRWLKGQPNTPQFIRLRRFLFLSFAQHKGRKASLLLPTLRFAQQTLRLTQEIIALCSNTRNLVSFAPLIPLRLVPTTPPKPSQIPHQNVTFILYWYGVVL